MDVKLNNIYHQTIYITTIFRSLSHSHSHSLLVALAQPVGRTIFRSPALAESGIQAFFPPAPARIWSEGLKQGLQLFITCPKLEQGFEAN